MMFTPNNRKIEVADNFWIEYLRWTNLVVAGIEIAVGLTYIGILHIILLNKYDLLKSRTIYIRIFNSEIFILF